MNINNIKSISILIINDNNDILTMYHNKIQGLTNPVGKVDNYETYESALKREAFEELGIHPIDYKLLYNHLFFVSINNIKYRAYDKCYYVKTYRGKIINVEKEKHSDLRFRSIAEITKYPKLSYVLQELISRISNNRIKIY